MGQNVYNFGIHARKFRVIDNGLTKGIIYIEKKKKKREINSVCKKHKIKNRKVIIGAVKYIRKEFKKEKKEIPPQTRKKVSKIMSKYKRIFDERKKMRENVRNIIPAFQDNNINESKQNNKPRSGIFVTSGGRKYMFILKNA